MSILQLFVAILVSGSVLVRGELNCQWEDDPQDPYLHAVRVLFWRIIWPYSVEELAGKIPARTRNLELADISFDKTDLPILPNMPNLTVL